MASAGWARSSAGPFFFLFFLPIAACILTGRWAVGGGSRPREQVKESASTGLEALTTIAAGIAGCARRHGGSGSDARAAARRVRLGHLGLQL